MQIRGKTLVWSAAGLLAVGTATGLSAATLLQSTTQTAPAVAATDSADDCILRFAAVGFCEPFLSDARGAIAQASIELTFASTPSL